MGIVTAEVSLWDPKVCRSFVAGTCVHDLFANTVSNSPLKLNLER